MGDPAEEEEAPLPAKKKARWGSASRFGSKLLEPRVSNDATAPPGVKAKVKRAPKIPCPKCGYKFRCRSEVKKHMVTCARAPAAVS